MAAVAIDHRPFRGDRAAHEAAIDAALRQAEVEIVCLAGYMRLLTPLLVDAWQRADAEHPSEPAAGFPRSRHACARACRRREAARLHGAPGDADDGRGADPGAGGGAGAARRHEPRRWRRGCWCRNTGSIRWRCGALPPVSGARQHRPMRRWSIPAPRAGQSRKCVPCHCERSEANSIPGALRWRLPRRCAGLVPGFVPAIRSGSVPRPMAGTSPATTRGPVSSRAGRPTAGANSQRQAIHQSPDCPGCGVA